MNEFDQDPAAGTTAPGTLPVASRAAPKLSDGEWHRLHPLTPLFRGGLFLVVIAGLVIANLRDRLVFIFLPWLDEDIDVDVEEFRGGDPIDFIIANNLYLVAGLVVLGILLVLIGLFYLSWRFHTFRITGDDVEVRSGVLFRTHRRAPLDRVQGVNLTRPMFARLVGMAKLEVVGAGLDSNVKLEYLSTANAEAVRADILRLASGSRVAAARTEAATPGLTRRSAAASVVTAGINGLISGAEEPVTEPESVVHIPVRRLVLSRLLSTSTLWLIAIVVAIIVGSIAGTPWVLFTLVPALIGFGAYWLRSITRSLRYSIAPTPSGVRITFGLFTTITEILPPGRVHAVEVDQSILWRPFGWWGITVNRLSGRGLADGANDQFTTVLPVGTRADVERVLRLLMPGLPESEWPLVFEHGILGPKAEDPYTNTPRRARLLRPLSWKRNGFLLLPDALLMRRGAIWRKLAVFPLARLQSIGIEQGPLDRTLSVANIRAHTITGRVPGRLGILDRDAALAVFEDAEAAAVTAASSDHSHRWADEEPAREDEGGASGLSEPTHAGTGALGTGARGTGARAAPGACSRHVASRGATVRRDGRLGVGIIGAGRVGPVIGAALGGAGHAIVGITSGSDDERAEAILPGVPVLDALEVVRRSELVVIAVPHDELSGLVSGLAELGAWQPGQLVLHTDPAFGTEVLAPAAARGAIPLAVHPAVAFTGTTMDLKQLVHAYAAVTAPGPGPSDRTGARGRTGLRTGRGGGGVPRGVRGGAGDRDRVLTIDRAPVHRPARAGRHPVPRPLPVGAHPLHGRSRADGCRLAGTGRTPRRLTSSPEGVQAPADRLGADFRGAPKTMSSTPEPAGAPEPAEDDVFEQKAVRLAKRERLIAERADAAGGAYPVGVPITDTIPALRARYGDLEAGAETGVTAAVAGRVVFSRNTGKLCFATLQAGDGSRIQAMVSLAGVGEDSLQQWKDLVDLGDHVFVSGEVISSRRGELSIMVADWQVAAKAILPLPNMYSELSEESRVRSRYLDLIVRDQARETVRSRAKVNASLRQTFADRGYIEVETPMLQVQHGGASARPFVTRSNAFDTELYLRIAPELFLKRAVVGGLDRVFEINRNFRNEGADSTHSPEFAMLESYEAYSDYNGIADLTQDLVQNAAVAVAGSTTVTWADGTEYDLGGQWDRISMYDSLSAASGVSITPQTSLDELRALAAREGVEEPPLATHGKLVEELWEHFVKGDLVRPTFVMDFPLDTSPLVREHRSIAGVVEKWDLYVRGFELATGYSELVDPVIQRERFTEQAKLAARGDLEAMRIDEEFLRALEHGMPPSGGLGMGIDRLLMAVTGLGIRETILFPLVK